MVWLRAFIFTALFPGTVTVYIPLFVLRPGSGEDALFFMKGMGIGMIAAGAVVYLACVISFGNEGRGTPAPYDPPRALVVRGLYRWSRNPIYVGMLMILIGETIFFMSLSHLIYTVAIFAIFQLRVIRYEERVLLRTFGPSYAEYSANVPRWFALRRRL